MIQLDWESIYELLLGFLGGTGLMALVFKEAINEKFQRDNLKWKEKRELAKDIMAFIDKGQGASYEIPVEFQEASRLISHCLPYDTKLSEEINEIQGRWAVYSMMNPERMKIPAHQWKEHLEKLRDDRDEIDEKVDRVRKKVTRWLK